MSDSELAELPPGDAALGYLSTKDGTTAEAHRLGLQRFLVWCQLKSLDPLDAKPHHLHLYASELGRQSNQRTIEIRQTAVKIFFDYLVSGTAVEFFVRRLAIASGSSSAGGGIEAWAGALRSL